MTITRVAQAAGVSRATVSRVVNGSSSVDSDLADRVMRAVAELRYKPNAIARSLALGRTGIVAILVPDLANPMFQGVLRGLTRAAAKHDVRLLVADSAESVTDEPVLALEARRRCDGIVLCAPRMSTSALHDLAPRLAPFVLVNRRVRGVGAPSLTIDHQAGIRDLVEHLVSLGHRRLAYLAGPRTSASNNERLRVLRNGAGHSYELVEYPCGATFADGHAAVASVVLGESTAIVAYNDLVALGALSALHERGMRVPEDMSVVGFDDILFSRYTTPSLTTASSPQAELGELAWERLWSLLNHQTPGDDVRFRPHLEVRNSTAPPRPS